MDALLPPAASSREGGWFQEPHCVIIGWARRERRGRGESVTAEVLGKDGGGVGRKDERQDLVEVYFLADGVGCQGGIHDHHCIPLICVSTEDSGKGCIFRPLICRGGSWAYLGNPAKFPLSQTLPTPDKEEPVTRRRITLPCPSLHFTCSSALIQLLPLT